MLIGHRSFRLLWEMKKIFHFFRFICGMNLHIVVPSICLRSCSYATSSVHLLSLPCCSFACWLNHLNYKCDVHNDIPSTICFLKNTPSPGSSVQYDSTITSRTWPQDSLKKQKKSVPYLPYSGPYTRLSLSSSIPGCCEADNSADIDS